MAETLNVKRREDLGSSRNRRLRASGQIPAVLYGHGEASLSLTIPSTEIWGAIKRGGRIVKLAGDVTEQALIRAVQWDVFGKDVLHIDLLRVSEKDKIKTKVSIELKGTAVGTTEGGVVEWVMHEVEIECPALSIPDKLVVNITDMHLGKGIHASEIALPAGAKMLTVAEAVIVHCVAPHVEAEAVPGAGEPGAAEPEVIGKKEKEEGEEGAEAPAKDKK
ncbi:MAG: 50S ribosomal protein L25 [Pirellulaceae bacterium]|nr:50S ribosomal protein L25 [Pirellulaceae bacterium]